MAEADAEAQVSRMGSGWNRSRWSQSAGSPEFQKLRKKNLVTSALSWFKVLRATSMNQKFPYILRISEKAKHVRFQVSVEKGLRWPTSFAARSCRLCASGILKGLKTRGTRADLLYFKASRKQGNA